MLCGPALLGRFQGLHCALQETIASHDERVPGLHALLQALFVCLFLGREPNADALPGVPDSAWRGGAGDGHLDPMFLENPFVDHGEWQVPKSPL